MKTSLIETQQIEAHLLRLSSPGEALLFEAKMLLDEELAEKLQWQKNACDMVKRYGRRQLKQEIEAVQQRLFSEARHKNFSEKIRQIFSKR
jgi:hypothetical protein